MFVLHAVKPNGDRHTTDEWRVVLPDENHRGPVCHFLAARRAILGRMTKANLGAEGNGRKCSIEVVAEENPYSAPDEDRADLVPMVTTAGLVLRVAGALVIVTGLGVAFLTREIWLEWLTGEPLLAWVAALVGAVLFTTWLRKPPISSMRRRSRGRLRDRRR
ncbi:MAG TPA: hypothetical protein VF881_00545 [Polyangiaceae bacterium]